MWSVSLIVSLPFSLIGPITNKDSVTRQPEDPRPRPGFQGMGCRCCVTGRYLPSTIYLETGASKERYNPVIIA
jgi:hypothetical protein